jgi:hypothetical protein
MGTKKLLAAYDVSQPDGQPGELLVPWVEDGQLALLGMRSGKAYSHGIVVYVGREVSEQDVFARLVDAGKMFSDLDQVMAGIARYVSLVREEKIGSVLMLVGEESLGSFHLSPVTLDKASRSKLPKIARG